MDRQKVLKRVGTHHGRFHADEVMATAILKEIFNIEVTRTRDMVVLNRLEIVYDVGGGKFDHHGVDKVYRENGIPYAASGLIWREFGREVARFKDPTLSDEEVEAVLNHVDRVLIQGIDAVDNGIGIDKDDEIPIMSISSVISGFNPARYLEEHENEAFNEAVELAFKVLDNTIEQRFSILKAREKVISAFEKRTMPQVIVLDTFCPWGEALRDVDEKAEVLYVVYPSKETYAMQTVRSHGKERKPLPKSWAGLRDEELAAVTGVSDAVFCHTGRFITVAKSMEGIMKLAELAIEEPVEREEGAFIRYIKRLLLRK